MCHIFEIEYCFYCNLLSVHFSNDFLSFLSESFEEICSSFCLKWTFDRFCLNCNLSILFVCFIINNFIGSLIDLSDNTAAVWKVGKIATVHVKIDRSHKTFLIMPWPYWKVRKIAIVPRKVANQRWLAYLSLAAIIAIVAILRTFQYGCNIIGKVYIDRLSCHRISTQRSPSWLVKQGTGNRKCTKK